MGTNGCAKSLPGCHLYFEHTKFYFLDTCSILSSKISIFRTRSHRPCFAFRLNPQPPDSCRPCIREVGFPPGSLSFEISVFRLCCF